LNQVDPITAAPHLRLVWPQWQGAGTESVRSLAPEFPFDIARRGYSVGTKVLEAVLPEHDGPTAIVPVEMGDIGLEERDGIEPKTVVLQQLRSALAIIQEHEPARITTVGGECSVSMAPFSYLINKHGDGLRKGAIASLWMADKPVDSVIAQSLYLASSMRFPEVCGGCLEAQSAAGTVCRPVRCVVETCSVAERSAASVAGTLNSTSCALGPQ
jgi:hypothetical protein